MLAPRCLPSLTVGPPPPLPHLEPPLMLASRRLPSLAVGPR